LTPPRQPAIIASESDPPRFSAYRFALLPGASHGHLRFGLRVLVAARGNGIGRILAATVAAHGARSHVRAVDVAAPARTRAALAAVTTTRACVASPDDVERRFDGVQRELGDLGVLVDHAGIAGPPAKAVAPVLVCAA
jgi:NAD(P)-dependent dehydrogenase (short-subunit alcohol dehydrogenase family)